MARSYNHYQHKLIFCVKDKLLNTFHSICSLVSYANICANVLISNTFIIHCVSLISFAKCKVKSIILLVRCIQELHFFFFVFKSFSRHKDMKSR